MSIYEYNEEYVRKSLTETGYEQGREDGIRDGIEQGKAETLVKSIDSIMENLKLDLQHACKLIGTTQEEYLRSKQIKNVN